MENFIYRNKCELCNSVDNNIILSKDFLDIIEHLKSYYNTNINSEIFKNSKYELAKCNNCGFIWQTYILNDKYMNILYEKWINSKNSFKKKKEANIKMYSDYADQIKRISSFINKKPFEINVLDYGMGWGFWAIMCKAFGYNISGFEIADTRIKFAEKNNINVINNISKLKKEQFHFINSEQVFEHIPDPLNSLNKLKFSLKKNGIIRIAVPNGKNIENKLNKKSFFPSKGPVQPLEHINCFNAKNLIYMTRKAGLKLYNKPLLKLNKHNIYEYVVEIFKSFYRNNYSTSLYFIK